MALKVELIQLLFSVHTQPYIMRSTRQGVWGRGYSNFYLYVVSAFRRTTHGPAKAGHYVLSTYEKRSLGECPPRAEASEEREPPDQQAVRQAIDTPAPAGGMAAHFRFENLL